MRPLVLDTNVVLDLLLFEDARTACLRGALEAGELDWVATEAMADELAHVLDYPNLARQLQARSLDAREVMDAFARQVRPVPPAPAASVTCRDPDDQKFIDLAVAHRGLLLSRDAQVLRLRQRLAALEVEAGTVYAP